MLVSVFLVGVALLVVGADRLVVGASALARKCGLSPLVIGLTVVALGTSAPEFFVSIVSSLQGKSDIAVGNVVGSNIGNLLLILGVTGILTPLVVTPKIIKFDAPVMLLAALLVLGSGYDGTISRIEGVLLILCGVLYLSYSVISSRAAEPSKVLEKEMSGTVALLWVGAGLVALVGGSQLVLQSAITIAKSLGMSELIIGLTIVAIGTSLPEIATSIIAARRGETDLSVGNIVGSNILNVFVILGSSGVVSQTGLTVSEAAIRFDVPLLVLVSLGCLPLFWTHGKITRLDSLILISGYVLYTTYLVLGSTEASTFTTLKIPTLVYLAFSAGVIFFGIMRTSRVKHTASVTE